MVDSNFITIGELSFLTGISKPTLRYYEQISLIKSAARTEGNYRLYNKTDVLRRLDFIKKAQSLRFTLDEIKSLLSLTYPQKPCNQARALLQQKIKNIQEEITNLKKQNLFLTNISEKWGSLDDYSIHDDLNLASPICELMDKV